MHAPPHGDRTALDDDAAYKGGTILEPWDREALMVGVKGLVKPWMLSTCLMGPNGRSRVGADQPPDRAADGVRF